MVRCEGARLIGLKIIEMYCPLENEMGVDCTRVTYATGVRHDGDIQPQPS